MQSRKRRFKPLVSGLICVLACALAGAPSSRQLMADVTLVEEGKPRAVIYVPKGTMSAKGPLDKAGRPIPRKPMQLDYLPVKTAVEEINYHLKKMSGAELEVREIEPDQKEAAAGPGIYLGLNVGGKPAKTNVSEDGFRLMVTDNAVYIRGQSDRAVLYGTYELLNRLGVDWVMPGEIGEVIPQQSTVVARTVDVSQAPDFPSRMLWYRGYRTKTHPAKPEEAQRFSDWVRRHRAGRYNHPAFATAGHHWDQFIRKHIKEFEADPTMYALRKNKAGELVRMGPQLESTHPRVIELYVKDIKETYEKNIAAGLWTKDTAAGFPIGPADGLGYSESPESMAASPGRLDAMMGAHDVTDLVVLMGNQILKEVHKEYPNAMVGFYSYSLHEDYPVKYKPDPKMVVIFAPINFSRFHGILDPNSVTQAYYRQVVEKWGELSNAQGNILIYRGYNWNLAENMMPYTKVQIWGEELPYYKKANFLGLNVEATKQWGTLAPSDWVYMKLSWDTGQDWKKLLKQYCQLAYGDGAEPMEKFNLLLIDRQSNAGQEAGSYHAYPLIYNHAHVQQMQSLIDQAMAQAKTPEQRTRIQYAAQPVEMLKLYLDYHAATLKFDFADAKEKFAALKQGWERGYELNSDIVSNEAFGYLGRFIGKFVDDAHKYSTGDYKLYYRVPDELPTMMDRDEVGHLRKYQDKVYNEAHWSKTKTISSTWDAQKIALPNRVGAVWYRVRFTGPAMPGEGQGVGLFMGGFEDEARVWLNGKFVGSSGRRYSNPAEYDLTDFIEPGKENVLAIMVVRNSAANELGLGGILRPSFIFTGPRLKSVAPVQEVEMRQVLPGGELGGIER